MKRWASGKVGPKYWPEDLNWIFYTLSELENSKSGARVLCDGVKPISESILWSLDHGCYFRDFKFDLNSSIWLRSNINANMEIQVMEMIFFKTKLGLRFLFENSNSCSHIVMLWIPQNKKSPNVIKNEIKH